MIKKKNNKFTLQVPETSQNRRVFSFYYLKRSKTVFTEQQALYSNKSQSQVLLLFSNKI